MKGTLLRIPARLGFVLGLATACASEVGEQGKGSALPADSQPSAPTSPPGQSDASKAVPKDANTQLVIGLDARDFALEGYYLTSWEIVELRCSAYALGGGASGSSCTSAGETCIAGTCRSDALGELPDYRADWAKAPPSGCGSGTNSEITIGQGEKTLSPLAEGATVTVECGPQGGHHLWLGMTTKDLAQWKTTTIIAASVPGTDVAVPATAYPYVLSPADAGACELAGVRFQLDVGGGKIADFLGRPLDIQIDAQDSAGRKASAIKRVNVSTTRSGPFCR